MEVHIIVHRWDDSIRAGVETRGAFADRKAAIKAMKKLAQEERKDAKELWCKKFDSDFAQNRDDYISFGWCNGGIGPDSCWEWILESEEVR